VGKIIYETEKVARAPEKATIKVVLNKNFEFK